MFDPLDAAPLRRTPLRGLADKAIVVFIFLIAHNIFSVLTPMLVYVVDDAFSIPSFLFFEYQRYAVNALAGAVVMTLALRDKVPGAIWIGLLAIATPLFAGILYLLSYASVNLLSNEEQ